MEKISVIVKGLKNDKTYERTTIDRYCFRGLSILKQIVSDDFFDLEKLPQDRFSKSGLFYDIPTVSRTGNIMLDNQVILACVFKVDSNKSSFCPLRIEYEQENEDSCKIWVYDQSKTERTNQHLLFEFQAKEKNGMYSEFENLKNLNIN